MESKEKVLIWSSNRNIKSQFSLKNSNIDFITASYEAELLALVKGSEISLILIEVNTETPQETIKIIHDIRQISFEIPLIIFSDRLFPQVINKVSNYNIYDYFLLPLPVDEIQRIIDEIKHKKKGTKNLTLLVKLSEKLQQLSIENEIIKLINTESDINIILKHILKRVANLLNVKAGIVLLKNERDDTLLINNVYPDTFEKFKGEVLAAANTAAEWAINHNEPFISNVVNQKTIPAICGKTNANPRTIISVPIKVKKTTFGVIELYDKIHCNFTNDDIEKTNIFASLAGLALNKFNLTQKEWKRMEEITLLFEIGTYLSGMLDLQELLQRSVQLIRRSFGFYYIGIALINQEKQTLELKSFDSAEKVTPIRREVSLNQGLMGWAAKHGTPIRIANVQKDKRYLKGIQSVRSEMVIPLKRKNTILGVIDLGSKKLNGFNDDDQILTEQIARLLSISIENAMLYNKVKRLAIIDDLTGLYNARFCHITLEKLMTNKHPQFSIIFLDLDFFKLVNDRFGHQIGGKLLMEVGTLIRTTINKNNISIRYGGDEYVIILPGMDKKAASNVASNILNAINKTIFLKKDGINYHITASLGVSSFPQDANDGGEILRFADRAMYWVKNHGRNNIKLYDKDVIGISNYRIFGQS
ncbi:MAG: hypothetical protein B5M53_08660 [Candidatus Cloacimonas sp. 4484_209]|nr:MAG: hypothetical protein B5M53_08660 [Candidatus Cloacimonas sp. 4484_209]